MSKTKKIAIRSASGRSMYVLPCLHGRLHIFRIKDPTSFEYLLWELNVRGAMKNEAYDEGERMNQSGRKLVANLWTEFSAQRR